MIDALFIGDSITEWFDTKTHLSHLMTKNCGKAGYSSGEVLDVLQEDWCIPIPKQVFICVGTNDIARGIPMQEILDNTSQIVQKVQNFTNQQSKIVLVSLFPTRNNLPRPNQVIGEYNQNLHSFAEVLKIGYLDAHTSMKDDNGDLQDLFTEDGLHLTELGYAQWAKTIIGYIKK